jgi:mannose/fructose/N-acetylgalactosamine-specific phosphotransferase system component IIB
MRQRTDPDESPGLQHCAGGIERPLLCRFRSPCMPIVLVRVDDRLVHGQILEGWIPSTRAQELLVANDAAASDETLRMIMESATPDSVRLVIESVDRIAELLVTELDSTVRRIIIMDNPMDALRLKRAGVPFTRLNLGNLRTGNGRVCLSRSVIVGDDSMRALREIVDEGVQVYIQSVPFEPPTVLTDCGTD